MLELPDSVADASSPPGPAARRAAAFRSGICRSCGFCELFTGSLLFLQDRRVLRRLLAAATLCLISLTGCITSGRSPAPAYNAVQISADQRDLVWEQAVDCLNRYHFVVARESKLEGVIETQYRTGANLLELWHPDSVGFENRLESTLQSIRRRVFVTMQSSQPGIVTVSVRVDKEIEDVPGLAANYEGGATFPEARPLDRDLNQVVGQTGPSRWIYLGRDADLERVLLAEISGRRM